MTGAPGPPPLPVVRPPWGIRPLRPDGSDLDLVHRWMNTPHVAAGWKQAWSRDRWAGELAGQLAGDHSRPCLVTRDGRAFAYVELYRVLRDRLSRYYPAHPHDLGMHVAIGDPRETGRGSGTALIRAVADGLLGADSACLRVVAEPDIANVRSVRAFQRAGFRCVGKIVLPHKTAALLARTRNAAVAPVG